LIIQGDDVLLSSMTGSGKTLAFVLPLLYRYVLPMEGRTAKRDVPRSTPVHLIPKVFARPTVLIVTPSRELAFQTHCVVKDLLMKFSDLNTTLLIGGANHMRQDESLKFRQPLVVIGTPGRIADHAMEGRLDLSNLRSVVLDEIDGLLNVSRRDHLAMVMEKVNSARNPQKILVSATGNQDRATMNFASDHLRKTWQNVGPKGGFEMPPRVLHLVNGAPDVNKKLLFMRRLERSRPQPMGILVFCNSFVRGRKVAEQLRYMNIAAEVISGNRSKESRQKAIESMNNGNIDVLVATDVATRGLDFKSLTHVVNFDLPGDAIAYAHRAGRCGRMGSNGIVISLASGGAENKRLRRYMKELDVKLYEGNVQEGELGINVALGRSGFAEREFDPARVARRAKNKALREEALRKVEIRKDEIRMEKAPAG